MRKFRTTFAALGAIILTALAATSGEAAETVIRADGYLDVAAGRVISPAVIVIDGDRITDINPATVPTTPAGAAPEDTVTEIDLTGHILVPGLTDVHVHLNTDIYPGWQYTAVKETIADAALRGAMNARRTLLAGFTTVRNVGSAGFADVSLMRAIDNGMVPGPRIIPAGHAISITGGHCDITGFAPGVIETDFRDGVADGADEVIKAVRYQIKHGAKTIKVCATAGVLSFEGPVGAQQMSMEELRAAVEEARRHGVITAAHAHGTAGIIAAAEAGITSIEHGSILDKDAVDAIKDNDAWYDPNLYLNFAIDLDSLPPPIRAKMEYLTPRMLASFKMALDGRLKIVFGTDAGVYPHGQNAREFRYRVQYGMSEIEAIRGATTYAAQMLGLDDRGQIAKGKLADIIAVPGNPLQQITVLEDVRFVMKGGHVYRQP